MTEPDPRRRAAEALLDWWALTGVDLGDSRQIMRAAPAPIAAQPRAAPASRVQPASPPKAAGLEDARAAASAAKSLAELRAALDAFDGCPLKKTARNTVFADGAEDAEVMLVGEAPGKDEDEIGKPFVGRSGQLMDRMFAAIGLSRATNLFISNIIFWRPPGNRPPTQGEIAACMPFIQRAIELKRPKLLVMIGGMSAQTLLARDAGITRLRGKRLIYKGPDETPVNAMAMFHPAYLLRRPQDKRMAWADVLLLETWLDELGVKRGARL
ncbi:MAG: uracil-DNA glycosylase [Pseudomonadota bacterium]|jgi:DNA polymerase